MNRIPRGTPSPGPRRVLPRVRPARPQKNVLQACANLGKSDSSRNHGDEASTNQEVLDGSDLLTPAALTSNIFPPAFCRMERGRGLICGVDF